MNRNWQKRDLLRVAAGTIAAGPEMLRAADTVRALRRTGLPARDLGVHFDGRTDDSVMLQRAIDEAARQRRPLVLPSGTAKIGHPLDLTGRHVAILGDPAGNTVLKASNALHCLIDGEETTETIDSPLFLYGLTLDGGEMTKTGLRLRYRHRTVFDTLTITACETGVDELDTWLARRINCRVRSTACGWRLRGANHGSQWLGCSFTNAREVHLDIGDAGTARDGNDALLFQGCDVEYGAGDGVRVAASATATFNTSYLGEAIGGDVLSNAGKVLIRGGALFVGHSVNRVGIRALSGMVMVENVSVRGQEFGTLDRLTGSEAGKAVFRDIDMHLKVGGNPVLEGDVLGTQPVRVFTPRLGRNWRATNSDALIEDTAMADARRVICRGRTGGNAVIGLAGLLSGTTEARKEGPAYIVIVYSASAPVELKASNGAISRAPSRLIGTLPASSRVATYIKVDVPVDYANFTLIELIMRVAESDELTLYSATIGDADMIEPGLLSNLAQAR